MIITREEKNIKLLKDIDIINNEILKYNKKLVISIILYGSYGRNEGAFYKINSRLFVYNDYDILIVFKNRIDVEELKKIKFRILDKINIRWIDISQKTLNELEKLRPSIYNFDLKYGSTVIYGNKDICNQIPSIDSSFITLQDAEILFFTRLYPFLGSVPFDGFNKEINKSQTMFFRNQMAKAILAIVDVILLQNKVYDSSYIKRNSIVKKIIKNDSDMINLFDWALTEKMYPKSSKFSKDELKSFYKKIVRLYFNEMMKALSKLYASDIRNTDDLVLAKKYSLKVWISKLKELIINKSLNHYNKQFELNILQSYIAEYYLLEEKQKILALKKIKILLEKFNYKSTSSMNNWDDIRLFVSDLRTY